MSINIKDYSHLKLENQLCFPLYACSKEIIRKYKPFLDKLNLTYTQYLVMLVLWENKQINSKSLGQYLYLDSGTLTPVLKKLEHKKLLTRCRSKYDERNLDICITEEGDRLKVLGGEVPKEIAKLIDITRDEAKELYRILSKILSQ